MSNPEITAVFSDDMYTCDITIGGHTYHNLRVKKVNLRDWKDVQMLYQVFIPCAKALGQNYYLAIDRYALAGRQHPEAAPLIFTPFVEVEVKRGSDVIQERLL